MIKGEQKENKKLNKNKKPKLLIKCKTWQIELANNCQPSFEQGHEFNKLRQQTVSPPKVGHRFFSLAKMAKVFFMISYKVN